MKKLFLALFIMGGILFTSEVYSQVQTPAPSPSSSLEQTVGLTDITIEYSRPGVKDREIFGGLVPYDEVWRTGANAATTIEFSEDVKIKGNKLEAGKYSLYTIPGENEWSIIFNKNWKQWGAMQYENGEDALRVSAKPMEITPEVESFTIDINDIRNDRAAIYLKWDNTAIKIPFTVPTDEEVMANIKDAMDGPSAGEYYAAASYYYEEGKDLKQALNWINKTIEEEPRYYILHKKALIQAELGMKEEAIKTAKKSMEMAKKGDSDHYIMLNKDLLKEWGAM